jgi:hypothetical protein
MDPAECPTMRDNARIYIVEITSLNEVQNALLLGMQLAIANPALHALGMDAQYFCRF